MNNIYFGSDWHFSRFGKRTRSMKYNYTRSKDILEKYPKMIDDDDLFILLGDLSYIGKKNTKKINECLEGIRQLPGKKILVKGNHDESTDKNYKRLGFKFVTNRIETPQFVLTHMPCHVDMNTINIHGHLHGTYIYYDCNPLNHVDAFTGQFRNYPIRLEDLLLTSDYIDINSVTYDQIETFKKHMFMLVE